VSILISGVTSNCSSGSVVCAGSVSRSITVMGLQTAFGVYIWARVGKIFAGVGSWWVLHKLVSGDFFYTPFNDNSDPEKFSVCGLQ
jgi:acetate kinase